MSKATVSKFGLQRKSVMLKKEQKKVNTAGILKKALNSPKFEK